MAPLLALGAGLVGGGLLGGIFGKTKKPSYTPLDISKVIEEARTAAESNLKGSIALENQYRPGTAALRATTDTALTNLAGGATPGFAARDSLIGDLLSSGGSNPLLDEATNRILADLKLGGTLDPETQSAAVRGALSTAGSSGIAGSFAGRGLVARDLGLTSLQLKNQRNATALSAGSTLQGLKLNTLNTLNSAATADTQRTGLLAGIVDARALPESGLSAGSIADLYVSDNNARNGVAANNAAISAQNRSNTIQGALGLGSLGLAAALVCWVAREVYGAHNPRWRLFREWLLADAPVWFLNLYLKYGERFAKFISNKPRLKKVIRVWMDSRINK